MKSRTLTSHWIRTCKHKRTYGGGFEQTLAPWFFVCSGSNIEVKITQQRWGQDIMLKIWAAHSISGQPLSPSYRGRLFQDKLKIKILTSIQLSEYLKTLKSTCLKIFTLMKYLNSVRDLTLELSFFYVSLLSLSPSLSSVRPDSVYSVQAFTRCFEACVYMCPSIAVYVRACHN